MPGLRVLEPGLSTTVQDLGRFGYQRFGVPTAGALDRVALAAANIVVGNPADTAGLEMLYLGATLEVEALSVRVAVAGLGASLEVTTGGLRERVAAGESRRIERGGRLRVVVGRASISAFLAVEGGLHVRPVMGSRSTFTRGAIGGLEGRALVAGDLVPLMKSEVEERCEVTLPGLDLSPPSHIRIVLGPQDDHFTSSALATLASSPYTITRASDRMGLRLDGPKLEHARGYNIVSDGTAPGSIQVPGDGLPIILLADRQTTGGYPKIATVASIDLPALGRLGPGAVLRFEVISVEAAEALRRLEAAQMAAWPQRVIPVRARATLDASRLYHENLVSGVTDGSSPSWLARPEDQSASGQG